MEISVSLAVLSLIWFLLFLSLLDFIRPGLFRFLRLDFDVSLTNNSDIYKFGSYFDSLEFLSPEKTSTSFENWLPYWAGFLFIIFSNLFTKFSLPIFTLGGWALSCNGARIRSRGLVKFLSKYKLIAGQAKKKRRAWSSASFSLPGRFENTVFKFKLFAPIAYMQCWPLYSFSIQIILSIYKIFYSISQYFLINWSSVFYWAFYFSQTLNIMIKFSI